MRELNVCEVEEVNGGVSMNNWTSGGIAAAAIGLGGTVATGGFGLLIGGAMMVVGYYYDQYQ